MRFAVAAYKSGAPVVKQQVKKQEIKLNTKLIWKADKEQKPDLKMNEDRFENEVRKKNKKK